MMYQVFSAIFGCAKLLLSGSYNVPNRAYQVGCTLYTKLHTEDLQYVSPPNTALKSLKDKCWSHDTLQNAPSP
jgi:hypothetical protein